jgi:hypothetical protein
VAQELRRRTNALLANLISRGPLLGRLFVQSLALTHAVLGVALLSVGYFDNGNDSALVFSLVASPFLCLAYGLARRAYWSLVFALFSASVTVFLFPVGTVLGVVLLVILLKLESVGYFDPRNSIFTPQIHWGVHAVALGALTSFFILLVIITLAASFLFYVGGEEWP